MGNTCLRVLCIRDDSAPCEEIQEDFAECEFTTFKIDPLTGKLRPALNGMEIEIPRIPTFRQSISKPLKDITMQLPESTVPKTEAPILILPPPVQRQSSYSELLTPSESSKRKQSFIFDEYGGQTTFSSDFGISPAAEPTATSEAPTAAARTISPVLESQPNEEPVPISDPESSVAPVEKPEKVKQSSRSIRHQFKRLFSKSARHQKKKLQHEKSTNSPSTLKPSFTVHCHSQSIQDVLSNLKSTDVDSSHARVVDYLCYCAECKTRMRRIAKDILNDQDLKLKKDQKSFLRILHAFSVYNEAFGYSKSLLEPLKYIYQSNEGNEDQCLVKLNQYVEQYQVKKYLCPCGKCPSYLAIDFDLRQFRFDTPEQAKSIGNILKAYTTYNEQAKYHRGLIALARSCIMATKGNEDQAFYTLAAFLEAQVP